MSESPAPPTLDRRRLLGGALAATLPLTAAAAAEPKNAAAPADFLGNEAVRLPDADLLAAFVRLRGSTDGSITYGWLDSLRYAVVDGQAHPLCRVLAGAIARYEPRDGGVYEGTILEITHYLDFATGELLDTLKMPVSGRTVKVPPYRFGPTLVRFAVKLDERESFSPTKEGKGSGNFAPLGEVRLQRSITDPRRSGGDLFVRHEEQGTVTPATPDAAPITYREWTIWSGPESVALDRKASYCPCRHSYTAMTSWRPWMQMDGISGHTLDTGRGAKARRFEDLPARYLALTGRLHPDVVRDPRGALMAKSKA